MVSCRYILKAEDIVTFTVTIIFQLVVVVAMR